MVRSAGSWVHALSARCWPGRVTVVQHPQRQQPLQATACRTACVCTTGCLHHGLSLYLTGAVPLVLQGALPGCGTRLLIHVLSEPVAAALQRPRHKNEVPAVAAGICASKR
jgi:hypothetical protein